MNKRYQKEIIFQIVDWYSEDVEIVDSDEVNKVLKENEYKKPLRVK